MTADIETPASKRPSKRLIIWLSVIGTGFLSAAGASIYQWVTTAIPDGPPLAAILRVGDPDCEGIVVDSSVPLPDRDTFTTDWAYDNGGATSSNNLLVVTVQGTTDQAVVLHGLEVVNLERAELPAQPHLVSKCGPTGGPLDIRYLTVDFAESSPTFIARAGGEEEAIDFPYTISRTEPEYLVIEFDDGSVECLCSWQLGIRWSSGNESGMLLVDRGFSKIRTAFAPDAPYLYWEEGGASPTPL